jgi:hypothetical protein
VWANQKTRRMGEKVDDPCGACFRLLICPVVTIDKSTCEMSKKYPWFEPFVEVKDQDDRHAQGQEVYGKKPQR